MLMSRICVVGMPVADDSSFHRFPRIEIYTCTGTKNASIGEL
jgi:hypothetical protein